MKNTSKSEPAKKMQKKPELHMKQKHEDVVTLVCHATFFSKTLEQDIMRNVFDIKSTEESDGNGNNIISTSINCKVCNSKFLRPWFVKLALVYK